MELCLSIFKLLAPIRVFRGSVGASKKRHLPRKKRQKQSLSMFKCNLGYLGQLKSPIYNIKNTFSHVR